MNIAFLTMVIIGIVYVIVMLVTGLLFFCCRMCGRCGAKDSHKKRRSDNCWRTIHKFSLILMVAFLVVPITCMSIINEHMKHSSPNVKGNITEVFTILGQFANQTDQDVDNVSTNIRSNLIYNFTSFKDTFVDHVQKNISNTIDNEKLEDIKKIVSWVSNVEDQYVKFANTSVLSKAVDNIKTSISNIRNQMKSSYNCSNSNRKICEIVFYPIPLEKIDINKSYEDVQNKMDILLHLNFSELKNAVDQIQNQTVLRIKIEDESEALKRFANNTLPEDDEGERKLKEEVKTYTNEVRKLSAIGDKEARRVFAETDGYERYRYWIMFGIAIVLLVPVIFVILGLICGCCGYEKDRHPTKRSSSSHCGGLCLILSVYYFFLVSSGLMLLTILLFVFGGNMQTFVCIPLYEENFHTLDNMKEVIFGNGNNTYLENTKPSQLLKDCEEDKSIVYALGMINESDPTSYEKFLKQSGVISSKRSEEIDLKLKIALLKITSGIKDKMMQFIQALSVPELKVMPTKLKEFISISRENISSFVMNATEALKEDLGENAQDVLIFVNDTAASLYKEMDELESKIVELSSILMEIYSEAEIYKDKIHNIQDNLFDVEEKLPEIIKAHLFLALVSSSGLKESVENIGRCLPVWVAFDMTRTSVCEFVVYPINGFWFGLGWALMFIIPTIIFSVKLSRYYLRMKYDDGTYMVDSGEVMPLEDMGRVKPFSYTNPGAVSWMPQFSPHQSYMVHPTASNQARHFHYK